MILKVFLLLLGSAMVYGNAPSNETRQVSVTAGSCPLPYVEVGSRCLLFFVSESGPWSDMEFLCQSAGGHLAIVDDANLLGDIVDFIAANDSTAAGENPNRKYQLAANEGSISEGTQACLIVSPTNVSSGYSSSSQSDHSSIVTSRFSHCPTESSPLDFYAYRMPLEKELTSDGKVYKSSMFGSQQVYKKDVLPATPMYYVPGDHPRNSGYQQIYTTCVLPTASMYSVPLPASCFLPKRPSVTPSLPTLDENIHFKPWASVVGSGDPRPIVPLVRLSALTSSSHTSGALSSLHSEAPFPSSSHTNDVLPPAVQPGAILSSQQSTFTVSSVTTSFSSIPSTSSSQMPQVIQENQSEGNRPKRRKTFSLHHQAICPKCSIVVASRGHLRQHMKSHNSVKPSVSLEFSAIHRMTCPTCGLVVATKGHLKQHIMSHSTSSFNRCFKCNCTFTQRVKLSNHLLRAHGISLRHLGANPQG